MKIKRKPKLVPTVAPTDLKDTKFIDELKKLSDEDLEKAFNSATQNESWAYTVRAAAEANREKGWEELVPQLDLAAGHARIAREVVASLLVQRWAKEDEEKAGKAKGGKSKAGGYL